MIDKFMVYIIMGLCVAGLAIGGVMFTQIQIQKNKILTLEIERDNLKAAFQVKQVELDNSKSSQKTLEKLLVKEKEESIKLEQELEAIRNEPESDNGSVSPLLRRGIDRLSNNH